MIDAEYIEKLKSSLTEIETQLSDPAVCGDRKLYKNYMTDHARQKMLLGKAEAYYTLLCQAEESREILDSGETDPEMIEFAQGQLDEAETEMPKAEKAWQISLIPPEPTDKSNTIIEIRAGTGGDEAGIFAGDLFRMYTRFADLMGWKHEVMDASNSETGGFKEITFSIEGDEVFKRMRYESGVHRVQRVPVTETQGRVHTSAATVAVLPEAEEVDIEIKNEDIRVDVFRASGPGGQSVNTTDSAIRVTHIPTGVIAICQDEKSQHRNKDKAMKVLRARIYDAKRQEEHDKMASERKSQIGSGDRSERIRTYNYPQNRLTDHRINLTLYSLDKIMEGDITELITSLYDQDLEDKLKIQMEANA